MKSEHSTL